MKRTMSALILVGLLVVPTRAQDCGSALTWYLDSLGWLAGAQANLDYAHLQLSWDVADGRGPGDPVYDQHEADVVAYDQGLDMAQGVADAAEAAYHAACY